MGFDMYLENVPADLLTEKQRYDEAESKWLKAMREHGHGSSEAEAAYKERGTDPTSFRLNIFGMGTYCRYMEQFNMLATQYTMPKQFSQNLIEAPLAGEEPGIPVDKLSSNDGWLVLPEECSSALAAYDRFSRDAVKIHVGEDVDYWDKWIAFIRRAADNGGFRVD